MDLSAKKQLTIDDLFHRNDRERGYCHEFIELMRRYPELEYSQRPYTPWQIDVKTPTGATMSCWPHKLRLVNQRTYASFDLKSWSEADPFFMAKF